MDKDLNVSQEEVLFTLHDEEGNEVLYRKILDFVNPENNKNYYILTENISDDDQEEIEIFPMIFYKGENGEEDRFEPLTTDEEWDMVEEVVGALYGEEENKDSDADHGSACQCGHKH